ncbi:NUDIX hydrolase [Neptuniibacter sp. QD48_11]|uniref:NUDIX hydrolase n=1 Tax=unclassified Neptuniibacter TaxID=2630693 RepID=UPI0039F4F234
MSVQECVCFVLTTDDQVLFEHRWADDKTGTAAINIPGGHIKPDESHIQALKREVEEELSVIPLSYKFLGSHPFAASPDQMLHYYLVDKWAGEVMALEAQDVEWVKPSHKLSISEADKKALVAAELM